jgi:hypothetical protein
MGSSGSNLASPVSKQNTGIASPEGQNPNGGVDVQNVLNDKTTQWKDWLQKPYNTQALNQHVMSTMFDPQADPTQRSNMLSTIDGNPDLKSYYTNLVNTFNTQK